MGKCFLKFVLMTALIHIGVLVFTAIKKGDIKFLNYFQILGLTAFWPKLSQGMISNILSAGLMLAIILSFLVVSLGVNRRKKAYFEISHIDKE